MLQGKGVPTVQKERGERGRKSSGLKLKLSTRRAKEMGFMFRVEDRITFVVEI